MIFNKTKLSKQIKVTLSTAIGAYIAIILAAVICGIEIGISGIIPLSFAVATMVYWHLLIGIGEAIISALIVYYIFKAKPDLITTGKMLGVE
jgi:cobalt/nickel transport system permease protein